MSYSPRRKTASIISFPHAWRKGQNIKTYRMKTAGEYGIIIQTERTISMAEKQIDQKLAEGIAYFEQMLQAMPEDRTTLEFLSVAYGQAGEQDKCRDALISLAKVLLKEGDFESASRIAERLEAFDDDLAKITALKVKAAAAPAPALTPETPSEETVAADNTVLAIREAKAAEAALVTNLLSRRALDDKTAESLGKHIEDLPESSIPFLVSALAFLEKENTALAEECASHLADSTGCPPVPLGSFDITKKLVETLPEALVRVRGAVPFGELGDVLLVALLNPSDDKLRRKVEQASGRQCRFFLCPPSAAEPVLEKLYAPTQEQGQK